MVVQGGKGEGDSDKRERRRGKAKAEEEVRSCSAVCDSSEEEVADIRALRLGSYCYVQCVVRIGLPLRAPETVRSPLIYQTIPEYLNGLKP